MNRWRQFWKLSGEEQTLFLSALLLLPFTAISLRLLGFKRTQALLGRLFPTGGTPPADRRRLVECGVRSVDRAAHHGIVKAACLARSLALWSLLRRRGVETQIRLGVRSAAGEVEAHAWVEWNGMVVNDQPDIGQQFTPLPAIF